MAFKTGILFFTLILGCLAVPVPEDDMSIFFSESRSMGSSRIVGGSAAANGAHPWMAGLLRGNSIFCGGSVISRRTVLTAAHCIPAIVSGNQVVRNAAVVVGTNRWNQGGQRVNVNGFIMHEQYNPSTIKNDIGMLYTSSNINFNNAVRAIPLSYSNIGAGVRSRVAGWGGTRAQGPMQPQLLEIEVSTLDGNQCARDVERAKIELNFSGPPSDPRVELCTFRQRGIGTCQGDSGSALARIDNGQQIGIVSWGFPCALGAPDMFVRVSAFQSWIQRNTRN